VISFVTSVLEHLSCWWFVWHLVAIHEVRLKRMKEIFLTFPVCNGPPYETGTESPSYFSAKRHIAVNKLVWKIKLLLLCVVQIGGVPPPCWGSVGTSRTKPARGAGVSRTKSARGAGVSRFNSARPQGLSSIFWQNKVISPPFPDRGVVHHRFEPHITIGSEWKQSKDLVFLLYELWCMYTKSVYFSPFRLCWNRFCL